MTEQQFKATIVQLILNGNAEEAIKQLSKHYDVTAPRLKVGLPKGRRREVLGCYTARDRTISVLNSDTLRQPFIIIHEFYHHLRTAPDSKHRGTEKHADDFAKQFIQEYIALARLGNDI